MTSRTRVGFFCTRLCVIAMVCLATAVGINAQAMEEGAVPPLTSGVQGAPVVIEIFNDYQCPPCGSMNEELKKVEAKYPNQVLLIFRNYPLTRIHNNAIAAAKAAEAAATQGRFREMIDQLYARRDGWSNEKDPTITFISYAKELGLDTERFAGDMTSEIIAERIALDVKRAEFLGVKGTPTLLMNGNRIEPTENNKLLDLVSSALLKH